MRRVKLALLGIAAVTLSVLTIPAAHAAVSPKAAAAPTAAQLLAKANSCTVASKGKYRTDEETGATGDIFKARLGFLRKAGIELDCDGNPASVCNSSTDPWYQG